MSDNVFFDTNVLVYAHTHSNLQKQSIAQELITSNHSFISTQTLQELSNILYKKFDQPWEDILKVISEEAQNNILYINVKENIHEACQIASRYGFSFYDSLVISAALSCNSKILYSEDLQDGQIINGVLKIVNTFKSL
jgi:predicted nucleic acid-binding protein